MLNTHGKNWLNNKQIFLYNQNNQIVFLSVCQIGGGGGGVVCWERQANDLERHTWKTSNWDRIYLIKYHLWLSTHISLSRCNTFAHIKIHIYSILQSQKSDLIGFSFFVCGSKNRRWKWKHIRTYSTKKEKKGKKWIKNDIFVAPPSPRLIFLSFFFFFLCRFTLFSQCHFDL